MKSTAAWVAVGILAVGTIVAYVGTNRNGSGIAGKGGSAKPRARVLREQVANDAVAGTLEDERSDSKQPEPLRHVPQASHPLLNDAEDAVFAEGPQGIHSTSEPRLREILRAVIEAAGTAGEPPALTIDYPQDETIFPPEIMPPTFLWHEPNAQADTWLIDIALGDEPAHIHVLAPGHPPAPGPIDPTCVAKSNEIYQPTPYQASAKSWTPSDQVWAAIKQHSVERAAQVTISGFHHTAPSQILSRGRISITRSRDPVGAPIFYRDVPLAPALTEKGVIKPLGEESVSLIGWRLRDISQPESRLLLTDVPTCTNCHSFSADGKTLGMDLDGPQGDKGAYVITSLAPQTKFEERDVISWNSFQGKPADQKTIGFLSQISPDGQFAVTTLNEAVYVCNFMDYRFLQVFFPTRGILGYYSRASAEIKALPGADDPNYVHCDAVWTPDGEMLVFARAAAEDPYPEDGRLAAQANDPAETQIQYDLYEIPFRGGQGGQPVPIAGASANGMSNTFPKVSPDGRWIVFVQCRNGQLLRPDSTLWIVPRQGGVARRMRCNTNRMNSWHSFSPNSRWLVFSSKVNTPYTQMFLTHIDPDGNDSPAVLIPNSTAANRAVNLPEFVNVPYDALLRIDVPALAYYRHALRGARLRTQGKFNEALAELDAAVKLRPDFQHAHVEAAVALTKQGRRDEALARLNKALSLDPKNSRAHGHAGIVLAQSGKLDEARARFETALRLDPYYRTAHANLGRIFLEQGKLEPATEHFRTSMELDETDPQGHFELGQVLFRRQMLTEAVEQFRRTLAIDPKHTDSHLLLSKALAMQGDFPAAVAQLRKATATDPNNVRPVADLAWLLAVCPHDDVRDGVKAVELAQRACAVTGYKSPVLLNTLAAAYAEIGDFSKAIATATKALSLVEPQDAAQAQWIAQNLEHFRAGKPCRAGAVAPSP